jgi:peptide deformylase
MIKPIVHIPNTVLTSEAKRITQFDKKLAVLIGNMKETLITTTNPKGVGLAAPQIGEPWQVFIIKPTEKSAIRTFINPEIVHKENAVDELKESKDKKLEGCLSIPKIWGKVTRFASVTLTYQDENGERHEELFTGFPAVIIQHETDHLHGTLFTHRVIEQNGPLYESTKDENGKEILEEIQLV